MKIKNLENVFAVAFALLLIGAQSLLLYADWYKHTQAQQAQVLLPDPAVVAQLPEDNAPDSSLDQLQPQPNGVPVLMYHHVGDLPPKADKLRRDLTVSATDFSAQLDSLQSQGFHSITTAQLYDWVQGKAKLPSKPVVLTFDDGYKDTFANAVPVLIAHHMQGVFAIITLYQSFPDYADWPTISLAKDQGMEIIPHTQTHIDLRNRHYSHDARVQEIDGSIQAIQEHLGYTPVAFVYPYGNYNDDAVQILKDSPIKIAFTTHFGLFKKDSDLLLEPRVRVHGVEDIKKFEAILNSSATK